MYQKFLTPDLNRLEKALMSRARRLEEKGTSLPPDHPESRFWLSLAAEFTELAGELHEL